jgi:phosphatidylglycerophosphate synthase
VIHALHRSLAVCGFGLIGAGLLVGCSSDGDGVTVTVPPGISLPSGGNTVPDDVAVTIPELEEPIEAPPAEAPSEAPPAEDPIEVTPTDPAIDSTVVAGADLTLVAVEEDTAWWPWALAIVLLVVVIVAMLMSRSRRRNRSGWSAEALTTIDASDVLTTHLLALAPEGLVVVARDDAQRLTDLDATTQELVRTAPDARRRAAIDGLRAPLTQLHAAVDMVAMSPVPTAAQLTLVHQWASALHVAASTARSTLSAPSS